MPQAVLDEGTVRVERYGDERNAAVPGTADRAFPPGRPGTGVTPEAGEGVAVPTVDELQDTIRRLARRLAAEIVVDLHAVSKRLRLGGSTAGVLALLTIHGPLTPTRIARLTGLSSGSVTGVVDRLERDGFVRREPDRQDRRRMSVVLVPDAPPLVADAPLDRVGLLDDALRHRKPTELTVIAGFLVDLIGHNDAR